MMNNRYCFKELANNSSVVYDRLTKKTLLLKGQFNDVKLEYEKKVFIPTIEDTQFSTFVLSITDQCNLRCKYCSRYHGDYKPNDMTPEMMSNIISSILKYASRIGEKCVVQFHGGEPTIRYRTIMDVLHNFDKKLLLEAIDFRIQTNCTNFPDEFLDFCREYHIQIGISLDGPASVTDALRKNSTGNGITKEVLNNIKRIKLRVPESSISCLCVVTKKSIESAEEIFDFMIKHDIDDVSFLPLYNDYSCINDDSSIIPRNDELLEFSKKIIDKWIAYLKSGKVVCIPNFQIWFWNLIANNTDKYYDTHSCCGMGETILFIDKDGAIYPCGPFSYESKMAFAKVVNDHFDFDTLRESHLFSMIKSRLPDECADCALQGICKCGCAANAYLKYKTIDSRDPYCDYWNGIITYMLQILISNPDIIDLIPDYTIRV